MRRDDHADAGGGPDPGAESGQAEHHVHDGRLGQHGVGLPSRLRRLRGVGHLPLPRRPPRARLRRQQQQRLTGCRIRVQPIRSAGPERRLQRRVLRPHDHVSRRARRPTAPNLPCEGSDTTCASPWTGVYVNGFAGYPGANSGGTINLTTGYPDTIWCWKSSPTTAEKLTADGNGSVCRRNGRAYSLVTSSGNHDAGDRRRLQLPEQLGHRASAARRSASSSTAFTVNGAPYYYTISQVQFCSAKDAAGWGTTPCVSQWDPTTYKYVRYGTGAATFDPQAFTRVDIKSTGFLVNGVSGGQSQRPHVRAGDDQLRQLVLVLPDADPVDEGRVRHRVLGAGPELARRLPHAAGEQHAVHERQGLHDRQQDRPGSPTSTR